MKVVKLLVLLLFTLQWTYAQRTVTGTVTDAENNEPLIGATVLVKGTETGTATDFEGAFSLEVPSDAEALVISYTGYAAQEFSIVGQSNINAALSAGELLEDVIVVGYTTQRKADISGSVSVVDLEEAGKSPYSNVLQNLQGRVPGVSVSQDGQPGQGRTNIRIRGITTLNNNQPLYVVDGVPTSNDISNINPNDIESIQVLKDAASASIYGSRSAGGVVIITTKKGKDGKLSIDAGTLTGIQTLGRKIDLLNSTEWGEVYWTASQNAGIDPRHPLYGDGDVPQLNTTPFIISNQRQVYQLDPIGTNWYDEVYQDALMQQHYVNVSNGSKKGTYAIGMSYYDQEGLIQKTYYDRITARFNSTLNINDWIQVGENMSVTFSDQVQTGTQQGQDGIPLDVIRQHPALPVFDLTGGYAGKIGGMPDVRNMVSVLEKNQDNFDKNWRIFGNAYAQINVLDAFKGLREKHDLILKSSYGVDYSNTYLRRFNASFSEGDFDIQDNFLFNRFDRALTTTFTNTAQYRLSLPRHSISVLGGVETIQSDFIYLQGARNGFENESIEFTYLDAGSGAATNGGGGTEWGLFSYFGRLDYTLDDKYILSGTVRYDQTSRLKTDGFFPAASIAWRASEEGFLKDALGNSTDLKIRASWGVQGNQNVGDFSTLSIVGANINTADYDLLGTNNGVEQGFIVLTRGNPNLRWESTTQTNIGFDASLLNGGITLQADYYIKETEDILREIPLLAAQGEGRAPFGNIATIRTNGFDFNVGYNYLSDSGDFNFSTMLQFTTFRSEVVSLGENIGAIDAEGNRYIDYGRTRVTVGRQPFTFFGHEVEGIFQSQAEVDGHAEQAGKGIGRLKYADLNADGVIDDEDRTYIGNPYPDFSGGLNLSAGFKGITLDLFLYGSVGQEVYNEVRWYMDFAQNGDFNRSTRILDAWSPSNTSSTIPAPILVNDNNENRASSYFVERGDFLRLRTARLGYTLPSKWTKDIGVNIYAEVQNIFTLTNYTGIDPEVPYAGGNNDVNVNVPGVDLGVYPLPRTFLVGVNVQI